MSNAPRTIKTVYFGPSPGRGKPKPVIKVTHGSRLSEVGPNVMRMMTRNLHGDAVVAEAHDEMYGELLFVATYFPGEKFAVVFEQDASRPVCIVTELGE